MRLIFTRIRKSECCHTEEGRFRRPCGGEAVKKPCKIRNRTELAADPQLRLCPKFDSTAVAKFRVASRKKMGVRVVDNCAEEHIM